jgi:hypothetical protein
VTDILANDYAILLLLLAGVIAGAVTATVWHLRASGYSGPGRGPGEDEPDEGPDPALDDAEWLSSIGVKAT